MSDVSDVSEESTIKVEIANGIQTLTMNRPDKKNALTHDMYAGLANALIAAEDNREVRVTVITGAGDAFTAGNDLQDFLAAVAREGEELPVHQFLRALLVMRKPLVAAVNGLAVGVGATMLLHCDLVYAEPQAKLVFPFVNLALVPEAGSTHLLPSMIGHARAAEIMLLGEPVSAERAEHLGLVSRIVEQGAALATAMETAAKLAAKPPGALRLTRELLKQDHECAAAAMQAESVHFGAQLTSDEAKEAMTAFFEKRAPDFSRFG